LATPLVVSVHTIVGLDFAVSVIPGWHTTVFPPYFVAGAIYSGFAMVLTIALPLRKIYKLEDFITMRHINNMSKVMLAMGLIVGYGYSMEAFVAWYSGSNFEQFMIHNRMFGPYGVAYWALILTNILIPQLLWFRRFRTHTVVLWCVTLVINIGMWLERYVIVVLSLHRDYMPSSWDMYSPSKFDWSMFIGTLGLFFALLFLFIRFLPVISIFEMRELVHETGHGEGHDHAVEDTAIASASQ
jgi:molybdopterin-containing oxidoreductase family membrane subunit